MSKKNNIKTMKMKTSNFAQTGEIKFNGKNWKTVIKSIPLSAKMILLYGVKGEKQIPIGVTAAKDFRKSVKTTFLNKKLVNAFGVSEDRRTSLIHKMEMFNYEAIKIVWETRFVKIEDTSKQVVLKRAA
jgi:hypothetical protein